MTSLLLNPLVLRMIGAGLAVAAAMIGWSMLTSHYEQIGYERAKAECRAEKAREAVAAQVKLNQMIHDRKKADREADDRYQKLAAEYDSLRRTNLGLRHTVGTLRSDLAAASPETLRKTADAALVVFDECTDELVEMAKAADGHAADVRTLTEAWPR